MKTFSTVAVFWVIGCFFERPWLENDFFVFVSAKTSWNTSNLTTLISIHYLLASTYSSSFDELFYSQGIQYLRFLVLVLSTFGIGIGIGIESIPGLVNGIDPIVNWY